jgi:signal transduction histidine kinase
MRIRTTAWVMLVAMAAIYALTGLCVYMLNESIREQSVSLRRAAEFQELGQQLANGSDYLTHEIQRYVITGDKIHYDNFWHEVNEVRSRDKVVERLKELGAPQNELYLIKVAKRQSDALINIERKAMDLVQAGDLDSARKLIFGDEYAAYKRSIMEPIARFQELLNGRVGKDTAKDSRRADFYLILTNVLLAISIALTLFAIYFIVIRRIVQPIGEMTGAMRALSHGDKKIDVPGYGRSDEIGDMAEAVEIFKQDRIRRAKAERALRHTNEELRTTLDQLREMQRQIVLQEKLASLGQLTAGVAHEIKNPLNFINNFSLICVEQIEELREEVEPLLEGLDADLREDIAELLSDLSTNLTKITQHGRRADGIVKGMLEHSRDGTGEFAPGNVNALIDEFANLAYHGMRAQTQGFNVTIHTDYEEGLDDVEMVAADVSRVFLNIVTNAFHALWDKQRKAGAGYDPQLWLTTRSDGNWVEIRIRDNGPGMPKAVLDKIF